MKRLNLKILKLKKISHSEMVKIRLLKMLNQSFKFMTIGIQRKSFNPTV